MRILSLLINFSLLFAVCNARAWVDAKNGNFVVSVVDHRVPGDGVQLLLQRTYNSVVTEEGLFGFGWCSTLETNLTWISPETAVIQECGQGQADVFSVEAKSAKVDSEAIDQVVAAVGKKLKPLPPDLRGTLESDPVLRAHLVRELGLRFAPNAKAMFLSSTGDKLSFEKGEYVRCRGKSERDYFGEKGELKAVASGSGKKIVLGYEAGLLKSVADARGNRLFLHRNNEGRVTEITAPKGKSSKYEYSTAGDLVKARNEAGESVYEYDSAHNMTAATRGDARVKLKYDIANDRVTEIQYEDCRETYSYDVNPKVTESFAVEISRACGGKPAVKTKTAYRYERPRGSLAYQAEKTVNDMKGSKTKTVFDSQGRMLSREGPREKTEVSYTKEGRVDRYSTSVPGTKETKSFKYSYEADGRLKEADLGGGKKVIYRFDTSGKLLSLVDERGRKLEFAYDPGAKRAKSVRVPGMIEVPLSDESVRSAARTREPASLQEMALTLELYDELYEPAVPALLGGRDAK